MSTINLFLGTLSTKEHAEDFSTAPSTNLGRPNSFWPTCSLLALPRLTCRENVCAGVNVGAAEQRPRSLHHNSMSHSVNQHGCRKPRPEPILGSKALACRPDQYRPYRAIFFAVFARPRAQDGQQAAPQNSPGTANTVIDSFVVVFLHLLGNKASTGYDCDQTPREGGEVAAAPSGCGHIACHCGL
jgi:hypothetical protein